MNEVPKIGIKGEFISDKVEHAYCRSLSKTLVDLLKNKSVVDFGCGDGRYLNDLQHVCNKVKGYDGNPHTEKLTNGLGECLDLSQLQNLDKYDWSISFEVGEHIPKEYEDNFIDNLCNHAKEGVILSWAIIGQPGEGHINCRNNDYVIHQFYKRNFLCDLMRSEYIRDETPVSWFKTNTLVFYRVDQLIK